MRSKADREKKMAQIIGDYGYQVGGDQIVGGADHGFQAKDLPLSFAGSVLATIAASAVAQLVPIQLLRTFRPDRFVVDRVQAASLSLADVKIGTVSLNASTGVVPLDAFSPDGTDITLRPVVTGTPALAINCFITNRTAVAVTVFSIGAIGPSAPG